MKEVRSIELFADSQKCCTVTPAEIRSAFPGSEAYFVDRDWQVSCEYLERFTDAAGTCRLDLQTELDGNTIHFAKTTAVFMIFAGLQKTGRIGLLPYQVAMRVPPYISARQAMAQIHITQSKRLDDAVRRSLRTLRSFDGSGTVDDVLDEILEGLPSVNSFAAVDEPDKGRYLPFFEILAEKAEACADPGYAERIGNYLDVLQ